MKYLAAKLAVVQAAKSEGKIRTEKIDQGCHPADSLTKPLQGKEFGFKRGRLLGRRVAPPRGRASALTQRRALVGLRARPIELAVRLPAQPPEHGAGRLRDCPG